MEYPFDLATPLDVELSFESPHVVLYRLWIRRPGDERWTVVAIGTDDAASNPRAHRLPPVPRGSRVAVLMAAVHGGAVAAQKPHQFPGSPALHFLESGPSEVMHPGTGRDLATELIQFVDPRGAVRQGAALDLAPWVLLPGFSIPLPAYQQSRLHYILANTTLSVASVRVSGEDGGTDLGAGFRTVLFNRADAMSDRAFTDRLRQVLLSCLPGQPDSPEEEIRNCHREARAGVLDDFLAERWSSGRGRGGSPWGWGRGPKAPSGELRPSSPIFGGTFPPVPASSPTP